MTLSHARGLDERGRYVAAASPLDRFMQYVEMIPFSGCWLWTGALIGKSGYGLFWHNGRKVVAHRWHYEQLHGTVQTPLQVCHRCDVRSCVNPAHLFVGSPSDNIRDARDKGRLKMPNRWALYPNGRKPIGEDS